MIPRPSECTNKIPLKAVLEFHHFFRGTPNVNAAFALRYWRDRGKIVLEYKPNGSVNNNLNIGRATSAGMRCRTSRTAAVRGHKGAAWVVKIHANLLSEFQRLRACGFRLMASMLLALKLTLRSLCQIQPKICKILQSVTKSHRSSCLST